MKFVQFPNEEATEIRLTAAAPEGTKRLKTAEYSTEIEAVLKKYLGKEIPGFRKGSSMLPDARCFSSCNCNDTLSISCTMFAFKQ